MPAFFLDAMHTPTHPTEAQPITALRALVESGEFQKALLATDAILLGPPHHREALYIRAVCQRFLGKVDEALSTLDRLEDLHPDYPRLYQERGHCHVAKRAAGPAIAAFEEAVQRNVSLPASWNTLKTLYRMTGRQADAERADKHVRMLAELPDPIVTAFSMYSDGEIEQAENLVRHYLTTHGNHVEAMRLLAKIGIDLDVADDAEFLLSTILQMTPHHHVARYEYVIVLIKQHKHHQALQEIERLLALDPTDQAFRITHATIRAGLGDYDTAIPLFRGLIEEAPQLADLPLSLGHAQKTLGKQGDAIASYRRAVTVRPNFGEAYWSLANLKTYRFDDQDIERMRTEEAKPRVRLEDRFHLCFALGKALEDRGAYADSFTYYERGNALKKSQCRYRPEPIERNAKLQREICTEELFARNVDLGCNDRGPIFIVGLPRAGSTLIEQILASHSQVEGTMELAEVPRLVGTLQGRTITGEEPRYPAVLQTLPPGALRQFGESYLADTKIYRSGKPFFIDKMPNNFRHLGLISLMLPNAIIIDARRDAMDCCFSNFKQLFASGQQFTYSFEDIARYYRSYVDLMEHWDHVLPGRILRVQHEDLVADLEGNVRKILAHCGLEFEPSCIEFHKTERRVHTASSEQVRRPISREGLGQWRHYAPWLEPLKAMLGSLAH